MATKKQQIMYMIVEKQYSNTTWYTQIREGIYKEAIKRTLKVVLCTDADIHNLLPGTTLVLLGSSYPFISTYVELCIKQDLRPIIAGFEIFQTNMQVSYITINRRRSMSDIVRALISCQAKHVALFGVNSAIQTDILRQKGYADAVLAYHAGNPETDVYYSDNGLKNCTDTFWSNYQKYDAVACANDYYASHLCFEANKRGIRIPDDLMITGFGNTRISQFSSPALTTVALNLSSVGTQVVIMYRSLLRNPDLLSCSAMLKSEIIFRESTLPMRNYLPERRALLNISTSDFEPTYEKDLKPIYALESMLSSIDEIDTQIIQGLLDNVSYASLSEKLFLSDSAFKYRLGKLFSHTECKNRKEFTTLLNNYIPFYTAK